MVVGTTKPQNKLVVLAENRKTNSKPWVHVRIRCEVSGPLFSQFHLFFEPAMANSRRLYDFVLLGATGYTGRLCAEYITTHLPTNLRWVAAGRSEAKVQRVVDEINRLNPDRLQADVLTIQLEEYELSQLARKAKIILNCIGPYHKYSTPVVEACAENGTHYLDVYCSP